MQHSHANIALNRQLLSLDVFACTSNNFNPLFLVSDSPGSHCNHSEKFSNINAHIMPSGENTHLDQNIGAIYLLTLSLFRVQCCCF